MTIYLSFESPLGRLFLTREGEALSGLYFESQKHFPADTRHWREAPDDPLLQEARRQIEGYLEGRNPRFNLPLAPRGSEFQRRVWRALQSIPYGQTRSYRAVAEALGRPRAVRAVAAAIGRNPISLLIPCHRVVGSDGDLRGYAGGLARKQALLALEAETPGNAP